MSRETTQARWRLLRAALLGEAIKEEDEQASIHRFQGFPLLIQKKRNALLRLDKGASIQDAVIVDTILDVEVSLMKFQCLVPLQLTTIFNVTSPFKQIELESLRQNLASKGIRCRRIQNNGGTGGGSLELEWQLTNEYICTEWTLPTKHMLLIRERVQRTKISLQALVSQQHHDGVDNTGNARVWDAEILLVHALSSSVIQEACGVHSAWNELAVTETLQVLELGAGMAGIAGLSMATATTGKIQVTITDGHCECVMNNKVHVILNDFPECANIKVEKLLWNTDLHESSKIDLLLCSDCTHFQEHHASLAVTIASLLRIGGVAILCQPPRGNSLNNFITCVESMNGILSIQQMVEYDEKVTSCHVKELGTNPCYDPNIHYPYIVLLTKTRPVADVDRRRAVQHVIERKGPTTDGALPKMRIQIET